MTQNKLLPNYIIGEGFPALGDYMYVIRNVPPRSFVMFHRGDGGEWIGVPVAVDPAPELPTETIVAECRTALYRYIEQHISYHD